MQEGLACDIKLAQVQSSEHWHMVYVALCKTIQFPASSLGIIDIIYPNATGVAPIQVRLDKLDARDVAEF